MTTDATLAIAPAELDADTFPARVALAMLRASTAIQMAAAAAVLERLCRKEAK